MTSLVSAMQPRPRQHTKRRTACTLRVMSIALGVIASMVFVGCIVEVEPGGARVALESGDIFGMKTGGTPGPKSFSGSFEFNVGEEGLAGYDLSPLNPFAFSATAAEGATGAIIGSVVSGDVGFDFEGTFTIDDFEIGTFLSFDAAIVDATEPTLANAPDPVLSGFFLSVLSAEIDGEFTIDALAVPEPSAFSTRFCALGLLIALRHRFRSCKTSQSGSRPAR